MPYKHLAGSCFSQRYERSATGGIPQATSFIALKVLCMLQPAHVAKDGLCCYEPGIASTVVAKGVDPALYHVLVASDRS